MAAMKLSSAKSYCSPELVGVSKKAGKAVMDYQMIEEGDRIAVAVSGGKDSLSLLHILRHRQRISPVRFDFEAIHVDFEFSDFNPARLVEYFQDNDFSYRIETVQALKGEKYEEVDCFRWSRARRKALFELIDRERFSKLAFGHHLDDIVETILLNQFYRAEIGAMKPVQRLFDGKITIIRPLAYVREKDMEILAARLGLMSVGQSKCANDDTSHRMKIKSMLREFEKENPAIVQNIFHSLQNIRFDYLLNPEIGVVDQKEKDG